MGWLQIGQVLKVGAGPLPAWSSYHPHAPPAARGPNNTLYVAAPEVVLDGTPTGVPGAGVFTTYDERLRLTKPGGSRSTWSLPGWFAPQPPRPPLGYHNDPARWRVDGDRVELRSAARGQEFRAGHGLVPGGDPMDPDHPHPEREGALA